MVMMTPTMVMPLAPLARIDPRTRALARILLFRRACF
jgi:hypothetical protein